MRYVGGKSRIAAPVAIIISAAIERERERESKPPDFVSLFCGTCSIESKVSGCSRKILNDSHEYLIAMFQGLQKGYQLPDFVSEDEYKYIRSHKDENPVLTGFVGLGCSFGGKWWGGFARNKQGTNYAMQSKKSVLKDMSGLMEAEFICNDYKDVELPKDCVIYADPPYNNTTTYRGTKFNSNEFWDYARNTSRDHIILISEQTAPEDFISIWSKPIKRQMDLNKENIFTVTENLYVHESHIDKFMEDKN